MADFTPTERTQVHRLPKRGVYDREAVYRILDEGLVCHVGFVADGKPVVIPTGYGRQGRHALHPWLECQPHVPRAGQGRRRVHHGHAG